MVGCGWAQMGTGGDCSRGYREREYITYKQIEMKMGHKRVR